MKHVFFTLTCLLLLSGCAISSEALRADPHQKGSIRIALPYPTALANLAKSANECFPGRGNPVTYTHTRVTEIESGRLARVEGVTARSIGEENVFFSVDLRQIPTGTEIDYYISYRFFGTYDNSSNFGPIAEAWARGDGTKCD